MNATADQDMLDPRARRTGRSPHWDWSKLPQPCYRDLRDQCGAASRWSRLRRGLLVE